MSPKYFQFRNLILHPHQHTQFLQCKHNLKLYSKNDSVIHYLIHRAMILRIQKAFFLHSKSPNIHFTDSFTFFNSRKRSQVRENSQVFVFFFLIGFCFRLCICFVLFCFFATATHRNLKISGTINKNWTLNPIQFSYSNLTNEAQPQPTIPSYYSSFYSGHSFIFKRSHFQGWEAACWLIKTPSNKNLSSGWVWFPSGAVGWKLTGTCGFSYSYSSG